MTGQSRWRVAQSNCEVLGLASVTGPDRRCCRESTTPVVEMLRPRQTRSASEVLEDLLLLWDSESVHRRRDVLFEPHHAVVAVTERLPAECCGPAAVALRAAGAVPLPSAAVRLDADGTTATPTQPDGVTPVGGSRSSDPERPGLPVPTAPNAALAENSSHAVRGPAPVDASTRRDGLASTSSRANWSWQYCSARPNSWRSVSPLMNRVSADSWQKRGTHTNSRISGPRIRPCVGGLRSVSIQTTSAEHSRTGRERPEPRPWLFVESPGQRSFQRQHISLTRMGKTQSEGVQVHPVRCLSAVDSVADDGVTDGEAMHSQLV